MKQIINFFNELIYYPILFIGIAIIFSGILFILISTIFIGFEASMFFFYIFFLPVGLIFFLLGNPLFIIEVYKKIKEQKDIL